MDFEFDVFAAGRHRRRSWRNNDGYRLAVDHHRPFICAVRGLRAEGIAAAAEDIAQGQPALLFGLRLNFYRHINGRGTSSTIGESRFDGDITGCWEECHAV